jgi:hypothetical protein
MLAQPRTFIVRSGCPGIVCKTHLEHTNVLVYRQHENKLPRTFRQHLPFIPPGLRYILQKSGLFFVCQHSTETENWGEFVIQKGLEEKACFVSCSIWDGEHADLSCVARL